MSVKKRVVLGLSGGVDSSVAAYLLLEQGYDVQALFMINWKDSSVTLSGDCSWEEDKIIAELVARKLKIPLHVVDSSEKYMSHVVDYMFNEYEKGRTPNPDVLCNREIKFDIFQQAALNLGADYIATGHYCKTDTITVNGTTIYRLITAADANKDQSYFLCQLSQQQLSNVLFPLGEITKPQVREIAALLDLASATKKDSQGICFVGKVDLPTFLQQKLQSKKGAIIEISNNFYNNLPIVETGNLQQLSTPYAYVAENGKKVGEHNGAHFYTIGQRKGLKVGGMQYPLFVIATDTVNNIVYVGQGDFHKGLYRKGLLINSKEIHWLRPDKIIEHNQQLEVMARIRYRQPLQKAIIYRKPEGLYMIFEKEQRGVTAGQFAVWYVDGELLGSGIISE